eukprot:1698423-Pyramimonas_sp.AAC.1
MRSIVRSIVSTIVVLIVRSIDIEIDSGIDRVTAMIAVSCGGRGKANDNDNAIKTARSNVYRKEPQQSPYSHFGSRTPADASML